MITDIFLDLDDTILDFHRAEREALTKMLAGFGITATDEIIARYSAINDSRWKLLERGLLSREEVKRTRYEILFAELQVDVSPTEATARYEEYLSRGYYFLDGAENMLSELSRRYRLHLVSNGTARVQQGRIRDAAISKYFTSIFVSEDIGYDKPSREFFDYCFARIPNLDTSRCVLIGDSVTSDIAGGRAAGIRTVLYAPHADYIQQNGTTAPDYIVQSLNDFVTLVDLLNKQ